VDDLVRRGPAFEPFEIPLGGTTRATLGSACIASRSVLVRVGPPSQQAVPLLALISIAVGAVANAGFACVTTSAPITAAITRALPTATVAVS
jgi:hypothetical protein